MRRWSLVWVILASAWTVTPSIAEQFHHQTFETQAPTLRLGLTDGDVRPLKHELTTEADRVHAGKQAERIVIQAASGDFCFIEYPIAPSLIFEEMDVSVWVMANRPGSTLAVRVVLPNEKDSVTGEPVVTLLKGDTLDVANRWRRLFLRRLDLLLEQQVILLQAQRKEKIDTSNAYVDQVLLDIHSGIGEVDISVDDLQVGPLVSAPKAVVVDPPKEPGQPDDRIPLPLRDAQGNVPLMNRAGEQDREIPRKAEVIGDQLHLGGRPFFMIGMRRSRAPLQILKEAGINTVFAAWPSEENLADQAAQYSMQLVPMLPVVNRSGGVTSAVRAGQPQIKLDDRAMGFSVGDDLGGESEATVLAAAEGIRSKDPAKGRPLLGDVADGFRGYSRRLDMVGAHRFPLMSTLDLEDYRRWLIERKNIARPGTMFWTSIQTHVPDDYASLVFGHTESESAIPLGPQPEQIRLLTFASLACGYRGIVYSSDLALAESSGGRDRLLQIALLNLELSMIEPFLSSGKPPMIKKSSHPKIDVAIFRHDRGVLVVPFWSELNAQYVLGQATVNDLQIIVESPPEAAQAFQITPGEARGLKQSRDLGGIRITIPEFDTVATVIMSTDVTLFAKYQELTQQVSQRAATWEKELAEIEISKTEQINAKLEAAGHPHPESQKLLASAREILQECQKAYDARDFRMAVANGARSRRASRLLQHLHWTEAVKALEPPESKTNAVAQPVAKPARTVAEKAAEKAALVAKEAARNAPPAVLRSHPFLASFYTLPEHYQFLAGLDRASFGPNRIESGDFERDGNLDAIGWVFRPRTVEGLSSNAMLVGDAARPAATGRRVLELTVMPKAEPPLVVENTRVEMVSPPVRVDPGEVVRITGIVRLPKGVAGSVDGAMVWDSVGGETLAVRFTTAGNWRKFELYRPINRSADLRVHLAMTGMGAAQFDDLKVEVTKNGVVPIAGQMPAVLLR